MDNPPRPTPRYTPGMTTHDQTRLTRLLETELDTHLMTLKFLGLFAPQAQVEIQESAQGWASWLQFPAHLFAWDRSTYPEAQHIAFLDGTDASLFPALLAQVPAEVTILKTSDPRAQDWLGTKLGWEPMRRFLWYTDVATRRTASTGADVIEHLTLDAPLRAELRAGGSTDAELDDLAARGARWYTAPVEGASRSFAVAFPNHRSVWEVGAVRTLEGWRRRGLAQKVVAAAVSSILSKGHRVRYHVESTNQPSRSLAESVGLTLHREAFHYRLGSPSFGGLPDVFDPETLSSAPFWDDEHISAQMLAAHLDPSHDAASRRPELRERTLRWLEQVAFVRSPHPLDVADLGCGPGLYAAELASRGHRVTGIDFSPRSLAYARAEAARRGLSLEYRLQSYLTLEDQERFDAALMIWCDFGALTKQQRETLLARVWQALRPGGTFVFDVWGPRIADDTANIGAVSWQAPGFWSPREHLLREDTVVVPSTRLVSRRIAVWDAGNCEPRVFYLRDFLFDAQALTGVLSAAGFVGIQVHENVLGPENSQEARVLFAVARRP